MGIGELFCIGLTRTIEAYVDNEGLEIIKTFFMHNSTEHEINPAHKR